MQKFTITGRVDEIGEAQKFGRFTKRQAVIDNSTGSYPSPLPVIFKKDKVSLLDSVKVGDVVDVEITIDGRKWDGPNGAKFFTDLTAWSVKVVQAASTAAPAPEQAAGYEATGRGALCAFVDNGGMRGDFAAFAQSVTGKKDSKSYTVADWVAVIAKANEPKADAAQTDPDDLPF